MADSLPREAMLNVARGLRDDLQALARRVSGPAAQRALRAFTFGDEHDRARSEARRLQDLSDGYMKSSMHVSAMFEIAEYASDDPPGSVPIRMLNEKAEPCRDYPFSAVDEAIRLRKAYIYD